MTDTPEQKLMSKWKPIADMPHGAEYLIADKTGVCLSLGWKEESGRISGLTYNGGTYIKDDFEPCFWAEIPAFDADTANSTQRAGKEDAND